jgi:hypothetical protein
LPVTFSLGLSEGPPTTSILAPLVILWKGIFSPFRDTEAQEVGGSITMRA